MENYLSMILHYLERVGVSTAIQLFVLFGPLLLLALIMNLISNLTEKLGPRVFGEKTFLYLFRSVGTPVHELGHALFALIFLHRITGIKLFDPVAADGSYGYVQHSYKKGNIYQETGRFFIGIGPVIMGSVMLYLITWLLFGFSLSDISPVAITTGTVTRLSSLKTLAIGIYDGLGRFLSLVFDGPGSSWWKIVLLFYFLFSIGSSITLSPPDIKGALSGLFFFVAILLVFNLLTLWAGEFTVEALTAVSGFFSGFYFLMILSIIINAVFVGLLGLLRLVVR